jgi:uncharacterized protein (DUF4415 family)
MKSASSRSAKPPRAKRASSSIKSHLEADEHPEADVRHIARGIVRRGLQPVSPKASISLRLDQEVLDWFKSQGPGYQTRMNAVLRAFRDASIAS